MQVLKFGGTSVANAENISRVKSIIEKKEDELTIVVVSALGGVTDLLDKLSILAEQGDESYLKIVEDIEARHMDTCRELIPVESQSGTLSALKMLCNELEDIVRGVFLLKELSLKSKDFIMSFGERLSSTLIYLYLSNTLKKQVQLSDPKEFILTDRNFGDASVQVDATYEKIKSTFSNASGVFICPGFLAATERGEIITLGRGGSDYTAALIAAALDAKELEIWTDVSGIMTADPREVKMAHPLKKVSYEEAMELSHFGAKVIYPPTVQPVMEKGVPVKIKNTFKPEDAGTIICDRTLQGENGKLIKGISCIRNIALLNLTGSGMVGVPNFSHRLFAALSRENINVIMITQASSEHSICVGIKDSDVDAATRSINEEFAYEISLHKIDRLEVETNLAVLALVGSNMKNHVGISGQMFNILGNNGISIKAIAQGSSELNISAVVHESEITKALNTLHESFFLSEMKRINLFIIGVGNVGSAFLGQLTKQQKYLEENHHLRVKVIGIANSRKMHFEQFGIELDQWEEILATSSQASSKVLFLEKMHSLNMRNSVFIDNTASADIAEMYKDVLKQSVSVVTPNKIACTRDYPHYLDLKKTSKEFRASFLFETNVCAGLPVISTLNDMVKSGDKVNSIQAVLSGSLNFIFNNYIESNTFAEVVKLAKEEGYTEPDPRLDLSGEDVMRKILILIREAGIEMESKDIEIEPFIPAECMECESVDEFFELLTKNESTFRNLFDQAKNQGKKLKYIASFENGKAKCGLQMLDAEHPFYVLDGTDNIVAFRTERYPVQPMIVRGAGAGAQVTASGIFADIMRIANN